MLSFAEIAEIIPTMFRVKNEPQGEVKADIKLSGMCCRSAASWNRTTWKMGCWCLSGIYMEALYIHIGEPPVPDTYQGSQLTINAIDGSVIDLNRGY